jgi:superfamily II DNA or RNA helicase
MIPQQAMSNDPLSPHTPSPLPSDAEATVTGADMIYLADLQPQPVEWLWQHRLAAGTLAMISGEPGSGKTWVCIATLRRAKFDIGVRSSKDGKSGVWWWTLPPPED